LERSIAALIAPLEQLSFAIGTLSFSRPRSLAFATAICLWARN
jgi:hypothetical protein